MFISIEGGDGVGKTTLARGLAKALRDMGYKVFLTEEPGGTKAGWDIKENIMKNNLDPVTEFLLFEADRAQHVKEIIEPCLREGYIVISDRYQLSTLAYQVYGREMDIDKFIKISSSLMSRVPDFTILLDGEGDRTGQADRIGGAGGEYHKRVRKAFLHLMTELVEEGRGAVIDAGDGRGSGGLLDLALDLLIPLLKDRVSLK